MNSPHQHLIDLLNQLKATTKAIATASNEQVKDLTKKMNPEDAEAFSSSVEEMKAHIKNAENLDLHKVVSDMREKIAAANNSRKKKM